MPFLKEDLVANHYFWTEDTNHLFTGHPSRRLFDRFNGNQMLFVINFYGGVSDKVTVKEGRIMEQKLLHELPDDIHSEMAVYNWLRNLLAF